MEDSINQSISGDFLCFVLSPFSSRKHANCPLHCTIAVMFAALSVQIQAIHCEFATRFHAVKQIGEMNVYYARETRSLAMQLGSCL